MRASKKRNGDPIPVQFKATVEHLLPIVRMGGRGSHADSIRAYREIGEIILDFVPGKPNHGDAAYAVLGESIGHGGEWVYRAKCFAQRYSKKEMEALLRTAPHISFAHTIQLLSVRDPKLRKRFQTELGKRRWTVNQLKHAIQDKLGTRRKGGRPIKLPGRLQDGLQDMLNVVTGLNRRWIAWRFVAAKSSRSARSQVVNKLFDELDRQTREFSQAVRTAVRSNTNEQRHA
jgi:hypothetical protein